MERLIKSSVMNNLRWVVLSFLISKPKIIHSLNFIELHDNQDFILICNKVAIINLSNMSARFMITMAKFHWIHDNGRYWSMVTVNETVQKLLETVVNPPVVKYELPQGKERQDTCSVSYDTEYIELSYKPEE